MVGEEGDRDPLLSREEEGKAQMAEVSLAPQGISPSVAQPLSLSDASSSLWADLIGNSGVALVYWKDPKKTTFVLAIGSLVFLLKIFGRYSYISLLSGFLLLHLTFSVGKSLMIKWTDQEVANTKKYFKMPEGFGQKIGVAVSDAFNTFVEFYFNLASGRDLKNASLMLASLLLIWIFGYLLNDAIISFLGFVGLFTIPYAYSKHQRIADEKIALVRLKIDEGVHAIMSRIPPSMQLKNSRTSQPKAS